MPLNYNNRIKMYASFNHIHVKGNDVLFLIIS